MLSTVGFNYYEGEIVPLSVTTGLETLYSDEANQYFKIIYVKSDYIDFTFNHKKYIVAGSVVICLNDKEDIVINQLSQGEVKILWFKPYFLNSQLSFSRLEGKETETYELQDHDIYYLMQFKQGASDKIKILDLSVLEALIIDKKISLIEENLEKQSNLRWPCRSRSYFFEILFCLVREEDQQKDMTDTTDYQEYSQLVVDIIHYLQSYYNQKITIDNLVKVFNTNRTTIITEFKKYTNETINQYLINMRLNMALTMLRDTGLTIDEISERTGFNDSSYFSKYFKKKLECSPSEYRKINHM